MMTAHTEENMKNNAIYSRMAYVGEDEDEIDRPVFSYQLSNMDGFCVRLVYWMSSPCICIEARDDGKLDTCVPIPIEKFKMLMKYKKGLSNLMHGLALNQEEIYQGETPGQRESRLTMDTDLQEQKETNENATECEQRCETPEPIYIKVECVDGLYLLVDTDFKGILIKCDDENGEEKCIFLTCEEWDVIRQLSFPDNVDQLMNDRFTAWT